MGFKRLDPARGPDRAIFRTTREALADRISQADGGIMLDTVLAFSADFVAPA